MANRRINSDDSTTSNYDQVFEESPVGLFLADSNAQLTKVNRVSRELLNLTNDVNFKLSIDELFAAGHEQLLHQLYQLRIGELQEISFEGVLKSKTNKTVWGHLNVKLLRQPSFDCPCFIGVLVNVTEAKINEKKLTESERKFRVVEMATKDIFWEWDRTNQKMIWNPGACLDYDANTDDLAQVNVSWWVERIHPDDRERVLFEIETAVEKHHEFWSSQYRFQKRDMSFAVLSDTACIEYDDKNQAVRIMGVKNDITEEKQKDLELQRARLDAQLAARVKSDFLANISHEIRTPLTAILGFAEFLADPSLDSQEKKNFIHTIKRNGHHLFQLINEVLDLSKMESGPIEIEKICFPLQEIVNSAVSALKYKADEKGIAISVELAPSVPDIIKTDPTRVQQILFNLINNAIKFTEKGSIQIHFDFVPGKLREEEGKLRCRIRDTGIGLRADQQQKLFCQFSQADMSTTRRYGGMGSGLFMARKLAMALGGNVHLISSEPGKGSQFEFYVLAGQESELQLQESKSGSRESRNLQKRDPLDLSGMKILLVDDSADNRALISRILNRNGARVSLAENGEEGHRKALSGEFDLILMDIQMPVMGGFEATRKLREAGFKKPVIALTALATREDRELSLKAGCDDHLTKPIDRSALFKVINRFGTRPETTLLH